MEENTTPWTPIKVDAAKRSTVILVTTYQNTRCLPRRPTSIKHQILRHSTFLTCARYYVSVFASVQDQRRLVSSKVGGVRIRRLGPWRDVSQVDVHSVRHGEHADRFCSSGLTTLYHSSVNKAIRYQVTFT